MRTAQHYADNGLNPISDLPPDKLGYNSLLSTDSPLIGPEDTKESSKWSQVTRSHPHFTVDSKERPEYKCDLKQAFRYGENVRRELMEFCSNIYPLLNTSLVNSS
ncbi:hypothetical protein J6590_059000 [Homalodisca vitripennis]|nr:hypothetical protein J6590_059000 [Homalodisca vitripennis]